MKVEESVYEGEKCFNEKHAVQTCKTYRINNSHLSSTQHFPTAPTNEQQSSIQENFIADADEKSAKNPTQSSSEKRDEAENQKAKDILQDKDICEVNDKSTEPVTKSDEDENYEDERKKLQQMSIS